MSIPADVLSFVLRLDVFIQNSASGLADTKEALSRAETLRAMVATVSTVNTATGLIAYSLEEAVSFGRWFSSTPNAIAQLQPVLSNVAKTAFFLDVGTSLVLMIDKWIKSDSLATDIDLANSILKFSIQLAVVLVVASPGSVSLVALGVAWAAAGAIFDQIIGALKGDGLLYTHLQKLIAPTLAKFLDPLVLDLDGDGVELTPLGDTVTGSAVHFDYGLDGFAERTGWVKSDDGLLVLDRNGNGIVDDASELFGSPDQDGFAFLEAHDANGDGRIDAADPAFASLRVWRDLDGDGVSDPGELGTLAQHGIVSLALTPTAVNGTNQGHRGASHAMY